MTSEEKQEGEYDLGRGQIGKGAPDDHYDLGPTGYTQRLPVKWPPEPGGPDGLYAPLVDKQILELRPEWLTRPSAPEARSVDQLLNHPGVYQILPGAYLFGQRGVALQTSQSIIRDPGSWTGMFIRVGAGVTLVSIGVVVWLLVR